jgi:hypothetical protein
MRISTSHCRIAMRTFRIFTTGIHIHDTDTNPGSLCRHGLR